MLHGVMVQKNLSNKSERAFHKLQVGFSEMRASVPAREHLYAAFPGNGAKSGNRNMRFDVRLTYLGSGPSEEKLGA